MTACWTVLVMVALLAAASGGIFRCLRRDARLDSDERIGLWLTAGPALICLASLLLADVGHFQWWRLVLASLVLPGIALFRGLRDRVSGIGPAQPRHPSRPGGEPVVSRAWQALRKRWPLLLSGLLLTALVCLPVLRPHTHLHGGWDPGEYVCTAMNVARTGALQIHDPFFARLDAPVRRMLMAEPEGNRRLLQHGYLVQDEAAGVLTPDYFHLYPAWLAAFAALGGLDGVYAGQWLITVLAGAMFWLAVKTLFSARVASLALVLLCVGPGQVYFGRFTTAEMLARFFLFSAFFWAVQAQHKPSLWRDLALGIALALALLAHSTSVLPLAAAGLFLAWRALWTGQRTAWRTVLVVGICALLAFARNGLRTPVMSAFLLDFITGHSALVRPLLLALAGTVPVLLLVALRRVLPPLDRNRAHPLMAWSTRTLDWLPGLAMATWLLFQVAVRPLVETGADRLNGVLVGRLAGPLMLILAGIFFARRRWTQVTAPQHLFLVAGAAAALVHVQHRMAYSLIMWSLRRYMPLVVPLLVVAGAVVLADMLAAKRRWIRYSGIGLLVLSLGGLVRDAWPLLQGREHRGLPAFTADLAGVLGDADFILCDHVRYATPLRYAWGLPAYQFQRQPDGTSTGEAAQAMRLLAERVAAGDRVYYVTVSDGFAHPDFRLAFVRRFEQTSETLPLMKSSLPRVWQPARDHANVYRCLPHRGDAGADALDGAVPGVSGPLSVGYHSMGLVRGFSRSLRSRQINFRWTDGRAALYVPTLGATGATLELLMASGREEEAPVPVDILLDGPVLATVPVAQAWQVVQVQVPPTFKGPAGLLELRSGVWNPAAYGIKGYPEQLGIRVARVQMRPDVMKDQSTKQAGEGSK